MKPVVRDDDICLEGSYEDFNSEHFYGGSIVRVEPDFLN